MHRNALWMLALFLAAVPGCARGPTSTRPKHVVVNTQTLAATPGEHYVVDLSQPGQIYEFDSSGGALDFGRIHVRSNGDERPLTEWLNAHVPAEPSIDDAEGFRLGRGVDFRAEFVAENPEAAARGAGNAFTCTVTYCDCEGVADCFDMVDAGVCGDWFKCSRRLDRCICERRH